MGKPLKETKVGKFLASKGFDAALGTLGNFVPAVAILDQLKDMVLGDSKHVLSAPDKEKFLELLKLEQQELDSRLADVANARTRQVDIMKAGGKDWLHGVVVIFVLSLFALMVLKKLFFASLTCEPMIELETTVRDIFFMVAAYYFGSSKGSRQKTELLAKNA